jgi:LysR family transcriptional regulator, nitrogen assimilation regulatory protein
MNLRSWRYFLKIAETRNVAAAARELHVAQPALSRHIAAMEAELGQPLLLRHRRGVALTDAGVLMRERATAILGEIDRLQDDLNTRASEPSGALAIGMPPSLAAAAAVPLLTRFRRDYARVRVRFREAPTEDLLAAVGKGDLDGAVATIGEPTRHFATTLLATDYIGLVAPANADIDGNGIRIRDLAGVPMILMSGTHFMADRINYAAARAEIALDYVMETNSLLQLELVKSGVAYAMMPMCIAASPSFDRGLKAAPFLDLPIEWGLSTPLDRPRSAAMHAFETLVKAEIATLVSSGAWRWGAVHPQRVRAPRKRR